MKFDTVIIGSLQRAARCPDMPAPAEIRSDFRHVHPSVGTQADFIFLQAGLIHENRALHAFGNAQLAYDSFQVPGLCIVKIHGLSVNGADDAAAVHKQDALKERPSQDLVLHITFFIKSFIDEPGKIKPVSDQFRRGAQSFRACIGILEYPGIVNHPDINRFCNGNIHQFLFHQLIDQLAGRAGCGIHIIDLPAAARIADVVVNVNGFFCRFKISLCRAQPVADRIHRDEYVVPDVLAAVCLDFFNSFDTGKNIGRFFQVYVRPGIRQRLFQIEIQAHAGTDAVPVRPDMAADCDLAGAFKLLQNLHHSLPPRLFWHAGPP